MKKFLALVLALTVVCSFGITAFAGSPVAPASSAETTSQYPVVEDSNVPDAFEAEIIGADGVAKEANAKLVSVGKADELEDEDKAAFLEAYEAVKAIKNKIVVYFFWLDLDEELAEGDVLNFAFECPGKNVEVTVNGNNMKVTPNAEKENAYVAELTENGAVAILVDAE